MKLKRISFKIISLIMVFTMLFGISANTISAVEWTHDDHTHGSESGKINYVSLGDSMTNGYGLDGYNGNTGVEDYGKGSYANLFAKWLEGTGNDVSHAQLAMSAMRIEDIHWLLEVDYEDEKVLAVIEKLADNYEYYRDNIEEFEEVWYSVFTNGDYWTWRELVNDYRFDVAAYCIEGKDKTDSNAFNKNFKVAYGEYDDVEALKIVAEYYQNSVKDADIISLALGNGNFGVFAFGRIMEAIGFSGEPAEAMIYRVENAIRELDPALQAKVLSFKAEIETQAKAIFAEAGLFVGNTEATDALLNTFVYVAVSFVINYMGTVDAIVELNPNA